MNNFLSHFGLVVARRSPSEEDLTVLMLKMTTHIEFFQKVIETIQYLIALLWMQCVFFPSMIVYIMVGNHSLDFRLLGINHLLGILRGHNYRVCSKYFSRQNILKGGIILL